MASPAVILLAIVNGISLGPHTQNERKHVAPQGQEDGPFFLGDKRKIGRRTFLRQKRLERWLARGDNEHGTQGRGSGGSGKVAEAKRERERERGEKEKK